MNVSDADSNSDMYPIQLKVHIVKFNIDEYNFTTKFVDNQKWNKSKYTANNLQYRSELNYNR
jgi:hypothetical protein